MPSSSLPAWAVITIMTTLVTRQRDTADFTSHWVDFPGRQKEELLEFLESLTFFLNVRLHRKLLQIIPKALKEYDCSSEKNLRPVAASVSSMLRHNSIGPVKKEKETERLIVHILCGFLILPLISVG